MIGTMAGKKHQSGKDGGAKPVKRKGVSFTVWMREDLKLAMEAYIAATRPQPAQKAVLETALEDFLAKVGFWPPPEET
jgi:hypothetical protein